MANNIIDSIQVSGVTYAIQGGGGGSCTVNDKEILKPYKEIRFDDPIDSVYIYYTGSSTDDLYYYFNVIVSESENLGVNGILNFTSGGHTGQTTDWETYYDVTWDSGNTRFLFAANTGYMMSGFGQQTDIIYKVQMQTISGTSCEAVESLSDALNDALEVAQNTVRETFIGSDTKQMNLYTYFNDGTTNISNFAYDDLKFENSKLRTDINVGLGTSGWTELSYSNNCNLGEVHASSLKFVYGNEILSYGEKDFNFNVTLEDDGSALYSFYINVQWSDDSTYSVNDNIDGNLTVSYDSGTSAITMSVPTSAVTIDGNTGTLYISDSNSFYCKFGEGITPYIYGEETEPIRQYVQENRAALSGKQDTLSAGTGIDITNNVISATGGGGGGKAIEAGRGIAVTTGETADTVSFNLPISADSNTYINAGVGNTNGQTLFNTLIGSGNTAYVGGYNNVSGCTAIGFGNEVGYIGRPNFQKSYSFAFGYGNKIQGGHSYAIGYNNNIGRNTSNAKDSSFLIGFNNTCTFNGDSNGDYIFGKYCTVSKSDEFALGKYNASNIGSTDADKTFFSIGNGTADNARHNAFEIRQNGDIYISSGGTDIKLQDHLGGGGGGSSYTAGDGIDITNNVISVTGKVDTSTYSTYTAATDTALTSKADTATTYTKTEVDNAITAATSTKQDTLISGTNIKTINNQSILGSGNIDIQGGSSYTAGDGIDITNNVISVTGKVDTSTFNTYSGSVETALSGKQDTLSAGTGISIIDNVISATGGGGGDSLWESGTGENAIVQKGGNNVASGTSSVAMGSGTTATGTSSVAEGKRTFAYGAFSHVEGSGSTAYGQSSHAEGRGTTAKDNYSHSEGSWTTASGSSSHAEGTYTKAIGSNSHAEGFYTETKNYAEHASGQNNVSSSGSSTFGYSGNTLFSVGNGTSDVARHNAFEIRQNGDIYFNDGTNDVKLQDKFSSLETTIGDINTILQSI